MPIFFLFFGLALSVFVVLPSIDLAASGLFYSPGRGFFLADNAVLLALHWLAYDGARVLGGIFAVGISAAVVRRKAWMSLDSKAWLFLLLALILAPGLVANVGLKDHWGRFRPREVVEFGGAATFTPALEPHFENAHSNGSFVAGDAAFGFFLPAFAYVAPRRSSRRVFWSMMTAGVAFGFARLAMGAHFLSDVLYAAAFMLATVACLHASLYGRKETAAQWKDWFKTSS